MLVEEGGEAFRPVPRVLNVHEVVGVRQHERFGGGQEREQEFVSLPERRRDLVAVGPQDGQDWLGDAPRLLLAERELHQRGPLPTEERVGVPHGLVEGTGNRPLERRTIARAEDTLQERVDGAGTVASLEPADRFAGVGPLGASVCSGGSSSATDTTTSGASSASCSATGPPDEWATMWADPIPG